MQPPNNFSNYQSRLYVSILSKRDNQLNTEIGRHRKNKIFVSLDQNIGHDSGLGIKIVRYRKPRPEDWLCIL